MMPQVELHPADAALALEKAVALHRTGRVYKAREGYIEASEIAGNPYMRTQG